MECIRVNGDLFDSSDTWTMGLPSCDVHWVIYIYIIIFVCFHYLWWHLHMFQASKINQMQEYNMCHKRDGWYLYGVLTSPNYQVVVSVFFLKVRCCLGNMSPFWQTYFSNRRWLNNRLYKINHLVKEIADVRPKRLWIQRTRIGLGTIYMLQSPLEVWYSSNPLGHTTKMGISRYSNWLSVFSPGPSENYWANVGRQAFLVSRIWLCELLYSKLFQIQRLYFPSVTYLS